MAWIESHEELENHPKVIHLESLMGWNRDETIGKLHRFWWWCLKYAPTGDLRKFNDAQVAGGVVLNVDDSKRFVEAMILSRWIDRSPNVFRVHEWIQYAGTYLRNSKFKRDPARWQETLAIYKVAQSEDKSTECPLTVKGLSLVPDQPDQPTNQPTNPGVVDLEKPGKDDDPLSGEIREYLASHPGVDHSRCGPKQFASMKKLVDCAGWEEAKRCIDVAVSAVAAFPCDYALKVFATSDARKKLNGTTKNHSAAAVREDC